MMWMWGNDVWGRCRGREGGKELRRKCERVWLVEKVLDWVM